jgi:hypothetical protein
MLSMFYPTVLSLLASSVLAQKDESKPVIPGASSYNGLALTPQMGWNNWNAFGCNINESILLDNAASHGKLWFEGSRLQVCGPR